MALIKKSELFRRLNSSESDRLFIDPLLEDEQIGEVTIDLRLGYDFLVSVLTRKPYISLTQNEDGFRSIDSYFQSTRREIGDKFIIYPGQIVLTTSLEYIGLPTDMASDIFPRSSYSRLGLHFGAMVQPGYRGCFPLEMANLNNNPIELIVGSRIAQCRFFNIGSETDYHSSLEPRKYLGVTRPTVSKAHQDTDIALLASIRRTL